MGEPLGHSDSIGYVYCVGCYPDGGSWSFGPVTKRFRCSACKTWIEP